MRAICYARAALREVCAASATCVTKRACKLGCVHPFIIEFVRSSNRGSHSVCVVCVWATQKKKRIKNVESCTNSSITRFENLYYICVGVCVCVCVHESMCRYRAHRRSILFYRSRWAFAENPPERSAANFIAFDCTCVFFSISLIHSMLHWSGVWLVHHAGRTSRTYMRITHIHKHTHTQREKARAYNKIIIKSFLINTLRRNVVRERERATRMELFASSARTVCELCARSRVQHRFGGGVQKKSLGGWKPNERNVCACTQGMCCICVCVFFFCIAAAKGARRNG